MLPRLNRGRCDLGSRSVATAALRAVEGATDVSFVQRFYRAASGEHFYTSNTQEAAQLTGLGFTNEGRAWAI